MDFFTKKELKIFLILWIIFSIFATNNRWDDNSSLDLTRAIVDEHRFEIDSYANNTGDRAYYNGHYYSDKVPGIAFLAVPLYGLYKFVVGEIPYHPSLDEDNPSWRYHLFLFLAISLISATCGALTIILVYRISKYFTSNDFHKHLIVIVLGLGTLLLHAGRQFNSNAISTFFIFLCFYLIFKMKKEKIDYSMSAGLAGGFAILSEYRAIILLFGLLILVLTFKKWKWILKFVIGISIFFFIILLYHYILYDHPFEDVSQHPDTDLWDDKLNTINCNNIPKYTNLPTPLAVIKQLRYERLKQLNKEIKIIRLLFYPFRGLIFYSPIILFSFLGLFMMYKKYRIEILIISSCFLINVLHLATSFFWWKGLSFGPKHLTLFIPFFMIPLLHTFKRLNIKIILFFITISILINLIGLQSVNLSHDPILFTESYCEKMKSYAPLANPLFDNYFPSLLNYGSRNLQNFLIIEKIFNFRIIPFVNVLLFFIIFLMIWKYKLIFKN